MFLPRQLIKILGQVTALLLLVLTSGSIALASFAPFAHGADAPILHIGNTGEPETLDPHRYNLRLEETLLNDLFLGLTTFSAAGELIPGAALSWSTSDDGLVWTFNLRHDLKWSDGRKLTAEDFVYSFRRLQAPETAASLAYFMYMLKNAAAINAGRKPIEDLGVSAPGPHTLVLELGQPYPYLLERLLYPTAFPVPRHVIEAHGSAWTKPQNWVSNGAYTLHNWRPQANISMRRNLHFFEPGSIEEVRYHPVVNDQSAYNRFRNKELHAIATFPSSEIDRVKQQYGNALHISDLLSMMYLVFNTQHPHLQDKRVRQALSLAIDQQILATRILRNGNKPAFSFAPSFISNYHPSPLSHATQTRSERIIEAKRLLNDAGFNSNHPLTLTLRHVNTLEGKKLNLAISGMWREIGVHTQLLQADLRNHFSELRQGNFDVAWAGWIGENNPEHYLSLLRSDIGNVNYGRFKSEAFDNIMRLAQQQATIQQRNKLLSQAEHVMLSQHPVVPLYTVAVRRLVDPNLTGWHDNPRDIHQVRYLGWSK
ncbi:MAG: peptide ABC transporter substrate-binding protein [Gammaproteobacteria bacterium]|nr:peptide ABC transporter substrate-binding protein [Gammaproteobacteria bacterium]